jgi:hypothetical protein
MNKLKFIITKVPIFLVMSFVLITLACIHDIKQKIGGKNA